MRPLAPLWKERIDTEQRSGVRLPAGLQVARRARHLSRDVAGDVPRRVFDQIVAIADKVALRSGRESGARVCLGARCLTVERAHQSAAIDDPARSGRDDGKDRHDEQRRDHDDKNFRTQIHDKTFSQRRHISAAGVVRIRTRLIDRGAHSTNRFPGFWLSDSGYIVDSVVSSAEEIAQVMDAADGLGRAGGILVANPLPELAQLDRVRARPGEFLADAAYADLARECLRHESKAVSVASDALRDAPLEYPVWGKDQIDPGALDHLL